MGDAWEGDIAEVVYYDVAEVVAPLRAEVARLRAENAQLRDLLDRVINHGDLTAALVERHTWEGTDTDGVPR